LDIRIRLQTHYLAGYPTGKPDNDPLWQVAYTLFKKLFVHGDNFLHERDGQRFCCWVPSWRKSVVQHFDGVL